jgi:hypothetical protein
VAFAWRYLDASGDVLAGPDRFGSRAGAEAWIAEAWADLLDDGVEEVELVELDGDGAGGAGSDPSSGRTVFRMSLREG